MSFLGPFFDDGLSLSGSKRTSGNEASIAQFVNPQYLGYGTTQPGFMTPEPSPTDATPRRSSFAVSENRSINFSGSSAASSFSGCGTPSFSTPSSSASSSRRQSMLLAESQQCYLSPVQSSPSNRPQRPKRAAAIDHCLLEDSSQESYIASTAAASLVTEGTAACTRGGGFTMVVDDYTGKAQEQWPNYGHPIDAASLCGTVAQPAQIDDSTILGRDFVADFKTAVQAPPPFEVDQPLFSHAQSTIFGGMAPQPDTEAYDTAGSSSPNAPYLAPAFEYRDVPLIEDETATAQRSYCANIFDMQTLNESSHHLKGSRSTLRKYSTILVPSDDGLECDYVPSQMVKGHSRRQRQGHGAAWSRRIPSKGPHRCQDPDCDYACNRPEHLRRHEASKHRGKLVQMHPCKFHECKDRRTGKHREIIARLDNLKAHYSKTHFRYGNSEKGGKNERKSMKAAYEMNLNVYDNLRWTMLLDEKMDVNHEIKDFLHVWKMLGYSILETRDTKVKSVVPEVESLVSSEWRYPDDETLQRFDPRWKALWNGTLTFDKALSVGVDMEESEAQGLLGVTMLETEAMGIDSLDPRWQAMHNGRMSVEQSEKLGVKQRNPLWKKLAERRGVR